MAAVFFHLRPIAYLITSSAFLLLYNEFLVYYIVLLQCQWPLLDTRSGGDDGSTLVDEASPLRAILLADTHLLGSREGHWFDKLRREWQMEQAFQASMFIHNPETVFILGDLFDEGKWCSDLEFQNYVTQLRKMFAIPTKSTLHVVVGNHDIGFHYMADEIKRRRFSKEFSAPSVRMLQIKGSVFVLLNSMAFEGDNCVMCREAETQLNAIVKTLDCSKSGDRCSNVEPLKYSRPIILQHFPMYRRSDENCTGSDAAADEEKVQVMKQRWDCLDKSVSDRLLSTLHPRLIISGHTHHFCLTMHNDVIPEWTIPSFSWRYKDGPSFLLLVATGGRFAIEKCYLPRESTVVKMYIFGIIFILVSTYYSPRFLYRNRTAKSH